MAQRSRPTLMKREREKARMERQKMKEARRADRTQRPADRGPSGADPDIAHIKPGPQPLADWQLELQQDEEKEENAESSEKN